MHDLYDCPKCGKPQSVARAHRCREGDGFCGACEAKYRAEEDRHKKDEIDRLGREMSSCRCEDGCCQLCCRRVAQILSLEGREAEAEQWLNQ